MSSQERERPFLERWARLKQANRARSGGAPGAVPDRNAPAAARPEVPAEPRESESSTAFDPADLPDPDKLGEGADFRVFLRESVPEELRRRALRRLWRLNPIISAVDPLVDYGEDYTDAARVVADLKTVFRVGREALEKLDRVASEAGNEAAPRSDAGAPPAESAPDDDTA